MNVEQIHFYRAPMLVSQRHQFKTTDSPTQPVVNDVGATTLDVFVIRELCLELL